MTKQTLAALKSAFKPANKTDKPTFTSNNYYPFWDMKPNQRAVLRFLSDRNTQNPRGFLVEKVFHNLTINGTKKTVPCLDMYGEKCPICKVSQDFYKAKDETNGKKYWRKKQYLAQALIVEDPLPPSPETGENHAGKVRIIALGYQVFNIISEAFAAEDDPLENIPYDFEGGYDFIIKKTEKGGYADYTVGTKFFSRPRDLTPLEVETAEEGMVDLASLLPKNPGYDVVQAMLSADLNGENYQSQSSSSEDEDDFAPAKPTQRRAPEEASTTAKKSPEPAQSDDTTGNEDIDNMLADIRARRNKK